MMGFNANRRGGRLPSFVMIALVILLLFISFNYWDVSRQRGRLLDELAEAQAQVKRTDAARSRLEKRNSELMVQVEGHRKEIDQKEGDRNMLRNSLQAVEVQFKRCNDEKVRCVMYCCRKYPSSKMRNNGSKFNRTASLDTLSIAIHPDLFKCDESFMYGNRAGSCFAQ